MKITPEHYATLKDACDVVLAANPDMRNNYLAGGLSEKRLRWDVLHAARINDEPSYRFICDTLYSYLNDTHIDTALRSIVK